MLITISALLPVFLAIIAGYVISRSGLVSNDQWLAIDHLAFYVLFPALVIKAITAADLSGTPVFKLVLVLTIGYLAMQAGLLATRRQLMQLLHINTAAFTSVFQACGRWHTWLGFAMMPALFGRPGLALAAVAAAAIVPVGNVSSVIVLSVLNTKERPGLIQLARAIAANPFVIAIALAVMIRMSGIALPETIISMLDLTGKGALGVALLSTGAGLRFSSFYRELKPILASVVIKMLILPAFIYGLCLLFGIDGLARSAAVLAAGVPTAAVSYIFARTMKGDAPLMASIMTLQIIVSALTIPLILTITG